MAIGSTLMRSTQRSVTRQQSSCLLRTFSTSPNTASHIGKAPIYIPKSVTISQVEQTIAIKGPLGDHSLTIPEFVKFESKAVDPATTQASQPRSKIPANAVQSLSITVQDSAIKMQKAQWGLYRALLFNCVKGVSEGFKIPIRCVGVGYRFILENGKLFGKLGYPQIFEWDIPADIKVKLINQTEIEIEGIDKQRVGQFAANIRQARPPEPYKLKGVFVNNETIKKKTPAKR